MLDVELEFLPPQFAQHMFEDRDVEAVLAAEIMIDHPRVGAGLPADRQHPRAAIALLRKFGDRGPQDALARPLGRWCHFLQHRANVRLLPELRTQPILESFFTTSATFRKKPARSARGQFGPARCVSAAARRWRPGRIVRGTMDGVSTPQFRPRWAPFVAVHCRSHCRRASADLWTTNRQDGDLAGFLMKEIPKETSREISKKRFGQARQAGGCFKRQSVNVSIKIIAAVHRRLRTRQVQCRP